MRIRETLNEILSRHTGQSVKKLTEDTERDNFMSALEAKKYGLIDEVIIRPQEEKKVINSQS